MGEAGGNREARYCAGLLTFGILHQIGWIPVLNFLCVCTSKSTFTISILPSALGGRPIWTPSVGPLALSLGLARGRHQKGTQGLKER